MFEIINKNHNVVKDKNCDDGFMTIVFSENRNKARYLALSTNACEDSEYTNVVAHRVSAFDKYYKKDKVEMDWNNKEDRIALVEYGFHCFDVEDIWLSECKNCWAKEYCETYKHYKDN